MKKHLTLLFSLCCILALTVTALAVEYGDSETAPLAITEPVSGTCGENLTWTLTTDGHLTISGTGAMTDFAEDGSPWHLYRTDILSVTIEIGVTSIGNFAFYNCLELTDISLPEGLTTVGNHAFSGCNALMSITIPTSIASIGYSAFDTTTTLVLAGTISGTCGDDLTWTLTPAGALTINGTGTMSNSPWAPYRPNILSATIGNGATSIDSYAFYNCSALTSISIPGSVTSIGHAAFEDCISLASITLPNSITSIANYAFCGCSALASVSIPESVTSIGDGTFFNCISLASVTLPNSITSIAILAFYNCSALTSISLPKSVTSIGNAAFQNCTALTNVYYAGTEADWNQITFKSGNEVLLGIEPYFAGRLLDYFDSIPLQREMTRLDAAKLLVALADLPLNATDPLPFTNCDHLTDTEKQIIAAVYKAGIMVGDANGSFSFDAFVKHSESSVLLCRVLFSGSDNSAELFDKYGDLNYFSDVPVSAWYTGYVNCLASLGIFGDRQGECFYPNDNTLFEEALQWAIRMDQQTQATPALNGLAMDGNGVWWYYMDGVVQTGYTGLVQYVDGNWYYVENGMLNFGYTGLAEYLGGWYYVQNGVFTPGYTGLALHTDDNWYFVSGGVLNFGYTGLAQHIDGVWYYVTGGVLDWGYTGLSEYYGGWYYVENGVLNWVYTGLVEHYGVWYYVSGGVLDWGYSGTAYTPDGTMYNVVGGVAQP